MPLKQKGIILSGLIIFDLLLLIGGAWFIWDKQTTLSSAPPISPPPTLKATLSSTPTAGIPSSPSPPASTSTPIPSQPTATITPTPLPANVELLGFSVAGRPIILHRFGSGKNERLIVAGIHGGNEYNTTLLAWQLNHTIEAQPEIIPGEVTLYIIPSLNPDGFERSWDIYGRANEHGVDLNHNFPYQWVEDWDRDGCWRYLYLTGGKAPASEPETQALMGFILSHPIQALISYHSAAMGIFPGGQPPFAPSVKLAQAIAKVSNYPYPPIDTGCQVSGNLTDWAASLGIPSVDIELSNHRDTDYEQNLLILNTFLKWRK